jgi:hypothetical protein
MPDAPTTDFGSRHNLAVRERSSEGPWSTPLRPFGANMKIFSRMSR